MSNYFETLKRLEKELRHPEEEALARPASPAPQAVRQQRSVEPASTSAETYVQPAGSGGMPAARRASYRVLLDNLHAYANGQPISAVVLAAPSRLEDASEVGHGLVDQTISRGLRAARVRIVAPEGRPVLVIAEATSDEDHGDSTPKGPATSESTPLDIRGGHLQDSTKAWLTTLRSNYDLVVIEAPPLGESLDGPMLGRICDGIVVVVEPGVTTEPALRAAVERARGVGCRVLGLVVNGTHDWLPEWMRRLTAPLPLR